MKLTLDHWVVAAAVQQGIPQYAIEEAALWLTVRTKLGPNRYLITSDSHRHRRMVLHGCTRCQIENLDKVSLLVTEAGEILALFDYLPSPADEGRRRFATKLNTALAAQRMAH
jgi:hypothetical protein